MSKALTGIKDIDFKILIPLTNIELAQIFQLNKYLYRLSFHESFWRERTIYFFVVKEGVFTDVRQLDKFRNNRKWKKYYKFLTKIINSYIKYSVHDLDIADTEDEEMIFQTFNDNGNTIKELLKSKDYKAVDEFLDTHVMYSAESESVNIFMEADPEGLEFLLSRSVTDYRIVPNLYTFMRVWSDHNNNYKILLKYMVVNAVLKEIFSYYVLPTLFGELSYILQQPGIKLETILPLLEDGRLRTECINLLKTKAEELCKIIL